MTSDPESDLFDFAGSNRNPTTEDEQMVTQIHEALGLEQVPLRLRRAPAAKASRSWQQFLPAAAAVILVIALLGAGFSTIVPGDEGDGDFASVPPVVLGLTGETTATPNLALCDFSGDIPFFSGTNSAPIGGPTVLLTLEEKLVRACNGDETVLLDGVRVAGPTMTPHVMIAITADANHLLNIVSGAHIAIPHGGHQAQNTISQQLSGPWVIAASTDDVSMTSVYNLAAMTEIPIVSKNGEPVAITNIDGAVVSSRHDRLAIALPNNANSTNSSLTGFFITDLTGESNFVPVDDLPMPRQIAISPDGTTIALSSYDGNAFGGTTTISMVSMQGGNVEQSWEMPTRDQQSELTWLRDGSMLILTDGTKLLGITSASSREGIHIFAQADVMQGIFLTQDDKVVVISQTQTDGSSRSKSETLFVNVETGKITTQPGSDPWSSPQFSATRTTLVLAVSSSLPHSGDNSNLVVVDAATGEELGQIDQDLSIDGSFQSSTWGYGEGDIVTVAFGPDSMWLLVDSSGDATLQQIPPPPLPESDYQAVSLVISPDGSLALRTFEPFSAWYMPAGSDEWIQIDLPEPGSGSMILPSIQFVIGGD